MWRLKKPFHKKRWGRATCHVVLPLPPLSTEVETSMAGVLMVVEPWGSETIHECKVSLEHVCLIAWVWCVYPHVILCMWIILWNRGHPKVEGEWLESTRHMHIDNPTINSPIRLQIFIAWAYVTFVLYSKCALNRIVYPHLLLHILKCDLWR